MNTIPPKDDVGPDDAQGADKITLKMIKDRAVEIAWINGRPARDLKPSDYVEARRDLMGQLGLDPDLAISESATEAETPTPAPDATGDENPATAGEDEIDAGHGEK